MPSDKTEKTSPAKQTMDKTVQLVTGGADLRKGYKSLGKENPATAGTGPTSDTKHKGYRTATGGKAS